MKVEQIVTASDNFLDEPIGTFSNDEAIRLRLGGRTQFSWWKMETAYLVLFARGAEALWGAKATDRGR
jgi:hypothetical protein